MTILIYLKKEIPLEIGREICSYFENNEMNPEIFDDVSPEVFNQPETAPNYTNPNINHPPFSLEGNLAGKNEEDTGINDNNFGGFDNFAIEPAPKSYLFLKFSI